MTEHQASSIVNQEMNGTFTQCMLKLLLILQRLWMIVRSCEVKHESDTVSPPRQCLPQLPITTVSDKMRYAGKRSRQQPPVGGVWQLIEQLQNVTHHLD